MEMVFYASVEPFRSCLHLKTLLQNSTEEDPGTWMDRKLCWLWFVISEGSSALAAEAPSYRNRVERDEYRRPKTYAVRVQFSLFLICWVEREKLLFLLFKSGFDDAMNMENDNINNSL